MNFAETYARVSRFCPYRRYLQSADFSLEANTGAAPEAGHFYLLRSGAVLLCTDDFSEAEAAYQDLCRSHWEQRLASDAFSERMASAWGLIGLDFSHRAASAVIEQEGGAEDRTRLTRARQKGAHARRLQARFPHHAAR